jgi:hypothetical protein
MSAATWMALGVEVLREALALVTAGREDVAEYALRAALAELRLRRAELTRIEATEDARLEAMRGAQR